jgi:hypothetical protein
MMLSFGLAAALAVQPVAPTLRAKLEAAFAERARQLDPSETDFGRLQAAKWVEKHAGAEAALKLVGALERCARKDPDPEVRGAAVGALAMVCIHHRRPCPVAHLEALLDPVEDVRWSATNYCGLYKAYEPGCVPVLLRALKSKQKEVRSSAVTLLGEAGAGDKAALAALREATKDPSFNVSHNAQIALIHAAGDRPGTSSPTASGCGKRSRPRRPRATRRRSAS